jgi:hypothetical protein
MPIATCRARSNKRRLPSTGSDANDRLAGRCLVDARSKSGRHARRSSNGQGHRTIRWLTTAVKFTAGPKSGIASREATSTSAACYYRPTGARASGTALERPDRTHVSRGRSRRLRQRLPPPRAGSWPTARAGCVRQRSRRPPVRVNRARCGRMVQLLSGRGDRAPWSWRTDCGRPMSARACVSATPPRRRIRGCRSASRAARDQIECT